MSEARIAALPHWRKQKTTSGGFIPVIFATVHIDDILSINLDLTYSNVPDVVGRVAPRFAAVALRVWEDFLNQGDGDWERQLAAMRLGPPSYLDALQEAP